MKKYLAEIEKEEGRKFDEVIVEASPFVRCLSTAARIAKPLGIKKIPINYLMSEW